MSQAVKVPITCPNCGAGLWDLEQTGYLTRRGVPVFEYHCRICETHFPLRSKHCTRIIRAALRMARRYNDAAAPGVLA